MELKEEDLAMQTVKEIERLGPFGAKNPTPLFMIKDAYIQRITPIGNDKHLKMMIAKGSKTVPAIAFSTSSSDFAYAEGDHVDVAGLFEINEYNGLKCLQITIQDIRLAEDQYAQKQKYDELQKFYLEKKELSADQYREITPKREHFVAVYQYIKNESERNVYKGRYSCLNRKIERHCKIDLNPAMLAVCLDVFRELSILDYETDKKFIYIQIFDMKGKIDLSTSRIWSDLKERDKEYSYGN
ncbi:hypothetical protein SDC9_163199 [bioreactor metagenome]|uniref:RecJ OB domain-containing protein n=1 Tax=bioreactor metagenome TaxID=1076179 RepID=A0A645FUZ7_9ZZZZ